MICTPIFINTFVVFVRLYWFERRFQNIARDARLLRRTKSRSRTVPIDDMGTKGDEKGVRGRSIVVLHNGNVEKGNIKRQGVMRDPIIESRTESSTSQRDAVLSSDRATDIPHTQHPAIRREITFADEVKGLETDDLGPRIMPQQLSPEEHIRILENQRNPKDKGALRIPGPRDFERGSVPEPLDDEGDGAHLGQQASNPGEAKDFADEIPMKRNVTFDERDQPRLRTNTLLKLSTHNSGDVGDLAAIPTDDANSHMNRLRARTGTFSSILKGGLKDEEPPTPYLSWQPTIGRNSAFVDLTEEQREELGGIEYRSLKTLAVVLVCK